MNTIAEPAVPPVSHPNHHEITGSKGSTGSRLKKPRTSAGFATGAAGTPTYQGTGSTAPGHIGFALVNAAALRELPILLARWPPDGRVNGREYEARNPRRSDRKPGSFRVNLRTGRWADFATGDSGGDPVGLAAFLFGLSQVAAGRRLADMLGVQ